MAADFLTGEAWTFRGLITYWSAATRRARDVLHVMHGPTGFEQPRIAFVPQIVEVQIDRVMGGF